MSENKIEALKGFVLAIPRRKEVVEVKDRIRKVNNELEDMIISVASYLPSLMLWQSLKRSRIPDPFASENCMVFR